tara:strand:+ start:7783 stop:8571 length:789 start_codon:yes stop_codon:yes gene_type:complete
MAQIASFSSNTESLLHLPARRLNYVLLIATFIHLLILLTVNINPILQVLHIKQPSQQLAVSLAQAEELPPELANYIGPQNHNGPIENDLSMNETKAYTPHPESKLTPKQIIALKTIDPQEKLAEVNIEPNTHIAPTPQTLDLHRLPRKKIISAATHQHQDAAYLYRWQQYIESIASETYPQKAIENNITGQLRLLVALKSDGSIYDVSIRQSSGQEILDKAALDIVQRAQPFESIPPNMLQDNEVVEIIRTWDFRGQLRVTS